MKKIVAINSSLYPTWNTATLVRETAMDKDYNRYNRTMFDPDHRKARHETVFPEDKCLGWADGQ